MSAILLTGGTGKTSSRIATRLQAAKIPFLLTSRRGQAAAPAGMTAVKFDWDNPSTYANPFTHTMDGGEKISKVYLVAPEYVEPSPPMIKFMDIAQAHGVKRVVIMSGSNAVKGAPFYIGPAWQHVADMGLEVSVLLCTWINENFSEWQHATTIVKEGKFYTATGTGKAPFVAADDIAAVAFEALTMSAKPAESYVVKGPELLSHDDVADRIGRTVGRKIEHVALGKEEMTKKWVDAGLPVDGAEMMVWLEMETATGKEAVENDVVETVTGRKPITFGAWCENNKAAWNV